MAKRKSKLEWLYRILCLGLYDTLTAEDEDNLWHPAQGDNQPEYGREVIVLEKIEGGSFKVCFGHRPDPKECVVVDGKKLFAQTYDKGIYNKRN